jgi:S1-C subfamily serine protease
MPSLTEWRVPPANQPRPGDYAFDLDKALSSVVGLHSIIPSDAFTAETLGTERAGNGVVIDDGLVLTIGYLVTEAEAVWLHRADGSVVEGHTLGFDFETGFGLVQALGDLDLAPLPLGSSAAARIGDRVVVGGAGGRTRSVASQIAAKQEFAGYWEYLLDEAIFTHPAHPNWGGTGLISGRGELIGIGSLQLERERETTSGNSAASTSRRGRGSACSPPKSTTASWWSESPARGRPRAPSSRPATSSSRSTATRSPARPASTESSGRSAPPASTYRSRSTMRASPSTWC